VTEVTSRWRQLLRPKIEAAILEKQASLAKGQVGGEDAATVGMNYKMHVGIINGLEQALKIAEDTDKEMQN